MSARKVKRSAASRRQQVAREISSYTDKQLDDFERGLPEHMSGRDLQTARRAVREERQRRVELWRRDRRLLKAVTGRLDVSRRRGPHHTLLGDDATEDRAARLEILRTYGQVKAILADEPRDDSDPSFVGDWLHGYLTQIETIDTEKARNVITGALAAVTRERRCGVFSKARRIVRYLVASVGIDDDHGDRRRVSLTDQRLRRLLARGDPGVLPHKEAKKAREDAARRGPRLLRRFAVVAREGSGLEGWRLCLEQRRRIGRSGYLEIADLFRYSSGPYQRRNAVRLGPNDETPIGLARDVVREWAEKPRRSAASKELARLFLRRRR